MAFLEAVKANGRLRELLQGAATVDAVVNIARDAGFNFNKESWLRMDESTKLWLTDKDLEGLAGSVGYEPCDTKNFSCSWGATIKYGYEDCASC